MAHARSNSPRMRKHWDGVVGAAFDFAGGSTQVLQQLGGTGGVNDAFTVLRILGEYTILPTAPLVQGDEGELCYAIGVISSDAATAGGGSVPDPIDEPAYPWLYWMSHPLASNGALEESALASMSVRARIDVKSMRKLKPSESLVSIAQYANVASGGNPPLTIVVGGLRVLVAH